MTFKHLMQLDAFCRESKVKETFRGCNIYDREKAGEWVYYDCYFDEKKIRERFNFPNTVTYYDYDGRASGQESGFIDEVTNDAILGNHPMYAKKNDKKKID